MSVSNGTDKLSPAARELLNPRLGGAPDVVTAGRLPPDETLTATATLLGNKINTRPLLADPQFLQAVSVAGLVFVFRHGVMVTFGGGAGDAALAAALRAHVLESGDMDETETATVLVGRGEKDRIGLDGEIFVPDDRTERFMLIATVLSRSVLLAHDEVLVAQAFEQTQPVVHDLSINGRARMPIREVMKLAGSVLAARHRLTGTAKADERPDLLWDHPELDRLYARLEAEYELKERAEALEHKFTTLGDFTEALLDIAQDKRSVRLEAAIVGLIVFEIVLSLFAMATGQH